MLLTTSGLSRQYPGVKALDNVDFSVDAGEVRALMGRNGAGKSTLIKLIAGIEQPDGGQMSFDGKLIRFAGPGDALLAGIATVHQELSSVHGLNVAENIMLGHWVSNYGLIDRAEITARANRALDMLGENIDPSRNMGRLSIAEQQLCEIARALAFEPRLLILDEPTSSLPHDEVERVLSVVRRVAAQGVAVLYVSHRMDEISKVADSVTVIRDGRLISSRPLAETTVDTIAREMIGGEDHAFSDMALVPPSDEVVLAVRSLASGDRVHDVSLEVRRGEVLGIAGLLGSGRTELLRVLAGIDKADRGSLSFFDKPLDDRSPRDRIRDGIALVPEDRKAEGVIIDFPVAWNLVLSCLDKVSRGFGVVSRGERDRIANRSVADLDVTVSAIDQTLASLSGGNQQKVVLGRCLNSGARLLLLDEPTRGIDVHAKAQVYQLVADLAAKGMAIIVVSSEYEELTLVCHRVMILRHGRVDGELDPAKESLDKLVQRVLHNDEIAERGSHDVN